MLDNNEEFEELREILVNSHHMMWLESVVERLDDITDEDVASGKLDGILNDAYAYFERLTDSEKCDLFIYCLGAIVRTKRKYGSES